VLFGSDAYSRSMPSVQQSLFTVTFPATLTGRGVRKWKFSSPVIASST